MQVKNRLKTFYAQSSRMYEIVGVYVYMEMYLLTKVEFVLEIST